jgi:hypothetical protein
MAQTKTGIANMALGFLGISTLIANLETEKSKEAEVCNLFFDRAVDATLEDFPWPEAKTYAVPGLVEEQPTDDWLYSYREPSDSVFVRRIVTVLGQEDPNPPPFEKGSDDQGGLIYTDEATPTIEYTRRLTDPNRFSNLLGEAIAWRLAFMAAPSLAKSDKAQQRAGAGYEFLIDKAEKKAGNERQGRPEPDSDAIRARQ